MLELKENYIISVDEVLDKIARERKECCTYSSMRVGDIFITFTYIGGITIHIFINKNYEILMHEDRITKNSLDRLVNVMVNMINMSCLLF